MVGVSFLFSFLLLVHSTQAAQGENEDIELGEYLGEAPASPSHVNPMRYLVNIAADPDFRRLVRQEFLNFVEATTVPPTKDQVHRMGRIDILNEVTRICSRCCRFSCAVMAATSIMSGGSTLMTLNQKKPSIFAGILSIPAMYFPLLFEANWSRLMRRLIGPRLSKVRSENICRAIGQVVLGVQWYKNLILIVTFSFHDRCYKTTNSQHLTNDH